MTGEALPRRKATGHLEEILNQLEHLKAENASKQNEIDRLRLTHREVSAQHAQELATARIELSGVADALHGSVSAFTARDTDAIPLVIAKARESALAQGASAWSGPAADMGAEVIEMSKASSSVATGYTQMAAAAQNLVWETEKLSIVVNACQTDLFKMRMDSNQAKCRMNQLRLMHHSRLHGFRSWITFVHSERYARLKQQMVDERSQNAHLKDTLDEQNKGFQDAARSGNAQQVENKVHQNIKRVQAKWMAAGWLAWLAFHRNYQIDKERALAKAAMEELTNAHDGAMAREVEIKIGVFKKRVIVFKMSSYFHLWDAVRRKLQAQASGADAERRAAELQQQEQQRIKKRTEQMMASIVGRKASQTLRLTFEALKHRATNAMLARKAQRRRAMAVQKVQQMVRCRKLASVYKALVGNAQQKVADRKEEQQKMRKFALFMKQRSQGVAAATFTALKIHRTACVEKRKADAMQREAQQKQDMLNDSRATQHQNAGLLRKMSLGFRLWGQAVNHTKVNALYARFKREEARNAKLQQALAGCQQQYEAAMTDNVRTQDKVTDSNSQVEQLLSQLQNADSRVAAKQDELASLQAKLAESDEILQAEKRSTSTVSEKLRVCITERDRLEAEINVIVEEIGFVRDMSTITR